MLFRTHTSVHQPPRPTATAVVLVPQSVVTAPAAPDVQPAAPARVVVRARRTCACPAPTCVCPLQVGEDIHARCLDGVVLASHLKDKTHTLYFRTPDGQRWRAGTAGLQSQSPVYKHVFVTMRQPCDDAKLMPPICPLASTCYDHPDDEGKVLVHCEKTGKSMFLQGEMMHTVGGEESEEQRTWYTGGTGGIVVCPMLREDERGPAYFYTGANYVPLCCDDDPDNDTLVKEVMETLNRMLYPTQ